MDQGQGKVSMADWICCVKGCERALRETIGNVDLAASRSSVVCCLAGTLQSADDERDRPEGWARFFRGLLLILLVQFDCLGIKGDPL